MAQGTPADGKEKVIGNKYRILGKVGQGGQSIVYRALDIRYGDEVAIKVLKKDMAADADARERLFREAQAMASLQGTSAVRVLDQQWTDDGSPCLVTEFLYGEELEDYLKALEATGERASVDTVVRVLDPVVHTLEMAHQLGIVHRDLKPSNIFLVDREHGGGVRLLDFGFAKFTRIRGFTAEHQVAGSPSYIAPESWQGKRDKLDHRIDVYGLGAVIYRCLAGETPFNAKDLVALLKAVTQAERPSLHARRPDLPPEIDDWVRQALAIDPADRFLRVTGLWRAFRAIVGV